MTEESKSLFNEEYIREQTYNIQRIMNNSYNQGIDDAIQLVDKKIKPAMPNQALVEIVEQLQSLKKK